MTDPDTGEIIAIDFANWLASFAGGQPALEISRKFAQLNEAVATTQEKGTITITFEVAPLRQADGICKVELKSLKIAEPMRPVKGEGYYHAEGGGLTRLGEGPPPKQPEFEFDNVTHLKGKAN